MSHEDDDNETAHVFMNNIPRIRDDTRISYVCNEYFAYTQTYIQRQKQHSVILHIITTSVAYKCTDTHATCPILSFAFLSSRLFSFLFEASQVDCSVAWSRYYRYIRWDILGTVLSHFIFRHYSFVISSSPPAPPPSPHRKITYLLYIDLTNLFIPLFPLPSSSPFFSLSFAILFISPSSAVT